MVTIKTIEAKNGRTMYYFNGVLTSPSDIKEDLKIRLEPGEVTLDGVREDYLVESAQESKELTPDILADMINELEPNPTAHCPNIVLDTKKCLFCGEPSKHIRFISEQNIGLCGSHYLEKSTGKVVAKLKESTVA